jgi:hypothetical protein
MTRTVHGKHGPAVVRVAAAGARDPAITAQGRPDDDRLGAVDARGSDLFDGARLERSSRLRGRRDDLVHELPRHVATLRERRREEQNTALTWSERRR